MSDKLTIEDYSGIHPDQISVYWKFYTCTGCPHAHLRFFNRNDEIICEASLSKEQLLGIAADLRSIS